MCGLSMNCSRDEAVRFRSFSTSTKETAIQIHLHGVADVGLNAAQVIQEFLNLVYWKGCAGIQGAMR